MKSSLRFNVKVFFDPYFEPVGNKSVLIVRGRTPDVSTGLEINLFRDEETTHLAVSTQQDKRPAHRTAQRLAP